LRVFVLQEIWIFYNLSREINTLQPVHSLLFKLKFSTLDRSRSLSQGLSIIIDQLVLTAILISIHLSVNSLRWTNSALICIVTVVLVS